MNTRIRRFYRSKQNKNHNYPKWEARKTTHQYSVYTTGNAHKLRDKERKQEMFLADVYKVSGGNWGEWCGRSVQSELQKWKHSLRSLEHLDQMRIEFGGKLVKPKQKKNHKKIETKEKNIKLITSKEIRWFQADGSHCFKMLRWHL